MKDHQSIGIGATVRLNSGGPECEVVSVNDDKDEVRVQWKDSMVLPRACVSLVRASECTD